MATIQELLLRVGGDGSEASSMFEDLAGGLTGMLNPATLIVGAITAISGALIALGTYGVYAADDLKKSLNTLQTQTGSTDKEMVELKDSLMNIYKNNFGESYDDIASSMSLVKQQSKALRISSAKDIEEMTVNAIILRDTFGFEVTESLNAATSLINNFGITGEEAFNLIAQGVQEGANKNGDLLDILNEYSPQFKALGFTSEQFFDTLITGSESGAWSIDKIGDSVKEFNIRSKDGSDATKQAFKDLGFNANKLTKIFSNGGKKANEAFYEVNEKLLEMKDKTKQNELGVALWGTMWEDLQVKGVKSIVEIEDRVSQNKKTLEEINNIKYDSFGEALSGLKRFFDIYIAVPIGEIILPILSSLMSVFMKVADVLGQYLSPKFEELKTKILDTFLGSKFNIEDFANMIISKIPEAFKFFKEYVFPIMDDIRKIFLKIIEIVKGEFKGSFVDFIKAELPKIGKRFLELLKEIKKFWDSLVKFSESPLFNFIVTRFTNMAKIIIFLILNLINYSIELYKAFYSNYTKVVNFLTKASTTIKNVFNSVWSTIKNIWNSINNYISNKATNIISIVSKLKTKIVKEFSGLSLYEAGKKIIKSLIDGIKSLASEPGKTVSKIVQGIRNQLPFSPAKEGPLKDLDKTGPGFIDTIIKGIKKSEPKLSLLVNSLANKLNIKSEVPNFKNNLIDAGAAGIIININEPHIFNDKDIAYIGDKLSKRLQSNNIRPERR